MNIGSISIPTFLFSLACVVSAQPGEGGKPARVIAVDFSQVRGPLSTVNDAYTMYLDMGAPDQLSRAQTEVLLPTGAPVQQVLVKHPGGLFTKDLPLRQNDVLLVVLHKL